VPIDQIVLTAFLSVVGAYLLHRFQWRREDQVRWARDRREAYSGFLAAVNRWDDLDHEAAMKGEIEEWHEAPPEDRFDPLTGVMTSSRLRPHVNAAALVVDQRLGEIELVGSTAVFGRARALRDQIGALGAIRLDSPPRGCGGVSHDLYLRQEKFIAARDAFVAAVRADLGT